MKRRRAERRCRRAVTLALVPVVSAFIAWAQADEAQPLPEPLTLEFALSLAGEGHPDLVEREAALARARAVLGKVKAREGVDPRSDAPGIEAPPDASDEKHDEQSPGLREGTSPRDAGRSAAAKAAAEQAVESERWLLAEMRHARRLDILRAYFDVLLADLEYGHRNEAMAIAFVTANRARERNALGQVSDIELFERESVYQRVRQARYAAAARQRATRAYLANMLNRPGELSPRLVTPTLVLDRAAPDHAAIEREALANNRAIKAARARFEAAKHRVLETRASDRPVLSAETGTGSRPGDAGDATPAGGTIETPGGGRTRADAAKREAELATAHARLRRVELDVRQALLEAWLALDTGNAGRDAARAFADYRDLYLDRSRALYEYEVRADLGDAMVQISESMLHSARADFELAMAWARLHGLAGRDPDTLGEWLLETGG